MVKVEERGWYRGDGLREKKKIKKAGIRGPDEPEFKK